MVKTCEKSATIVQCLLKYWMKALNDCDGPEGCAPLRALFAEGDGAIDVRDEAFGRVIKATDFDEYERQWEEAADHVRTMSFSLEGEPAVRISEERAEMRFILVAEGTYENGAAIEPRLRWRGEHDWRQIDGEWRIIRERLSAL